MIRVTDLLCFGARGSDCIIFFFFNDIANNLDV